MAARLDLRLMTARQSRRRTKLRRRSQRIQTQTLHDDSNCTTRQLSRGVMFTRSSPSTPTILRGDGRIKHRLYRRTSSEKRCVFTPRATSKDKDTLYTPLDSHVEESAADLRDEDFFDDVSSTPSPSAVTSHHSRSPTFEDWKQEADRHCIVETYGISWAQTAVDIVRDLLKSFDALSLHRFQTNIDRRHLYITLDKFEDRYGSPSLDEITDFSRSLTARLEEALGQEMAEAIQCEVSTPGAERDVRLPFELDRFRSLPMTVTFKQEDGTTHTEVLQYLDRDEEISVWRYWKRKSYRPTSKSKKAKLKKKEERVYEIPLRHLTRVRLFLDI